MAAMVKNSTPFHSYPGESALMSAPLQTQSSTELSTVKPAANNRSSTDSAGRLLPQPPRSPDIGSPTSAGPSPIAPSSNGTDIDDTATEGEKALQAGDFASTSTPSSIKRSSVTVVTTDNEGNVLRTESPEANPASVIHAPTDYLTFPPNSPPNFGRITPTPAARLEASTTSSRTSVGDSSDLSSAHTPLSPPPIDTAVRPVHDPFATPRATTRSDIDPDRKERGRKPSLENIPEDSAVEETDDDERPQSAFFESDADRLRRAGEEVAALKDALSECWTLCNTLAGLSSLHRERAFRHATREDKREQAWKSCWVLCQKLYETRDEEQVTEAGPTLDLCREFCQSLFEVRQKGDDVADSVLRVSFELNNHLFNTHDRSLPEEFRERTMDFYITLCHRLMKQRNAMVEEADSLLRACWGLAEMLFSLRQNKREGKPYNEELLGSAVQACWELCDLFREGWTQVRPDRGTPRPSSIGFSHFSSSSRQHERPKSVSTIDIGESSDEDVDEGRLNPETPTTIFEDTNQLSPDEASVPNILVLGPEATEYPLPRWSSSVSDVGSHYSSAESHRSGVSHGSEHVGAGLGPFATTSNVMGAEQGSDGPNQADRARLACLKLLMIRTAQIIGFDRAKNPAALQQFVKSAPSNSFGTSPWQHHLLEDYKKLVASDPAFRSAGPATRASAQDVARAVKWMVRSGQYVWLEELYRWVLGFRVDEARDRNITWVQT